MAEPVPAAESVADLFHENMPLDQQVDLLAGYLMERFGGPWRSMGAVEMACRILDQIDPAEVNTHDA